MPESGDTFWLIASSIMHSMRRSATFHVRLCQIFPQSISVATIYERLPEYTILFRL